MRSLVILIILLYYNQSFTSAEFFDLVTVTFKEFASRVVVTFKSIKNKIKNFFYDKMIENTEAMVTEHHIEENKIKQAFNDFVEQTAADNETENPEYYSLKTEPTALMSTSQLVTIHGRRIESHIVHTKDGYFLTLHRILSPSDHITKLTNQTVLLYHGLLGSSADWVLLGPAKSLPYLLSNAGCDVWMANARGNYYSRGHTSKKVESIEFWKFSWQEMGQYDLPAVIDYIRTLKNTSDRINYIGHSMGATALLVLLSMEPEYNDLLRIGILLAPLAFMGNIKGPLTMFTHMASNPPKQLLRQIGDGEFLSSRRIPKWIATKFCKGPKIFCSNSLLFISGIPQQRTWKTSLIARVLFHIPAGGSTNTIMHYAQLANSGKFHAFGDFSNEFPLSKITLPIALFSSTEDYLATIPDVLRLYFSLANPIDHYVIRDKNLSHTEFVWGTNADNLVFTKVIYFLENGMNSNIVMDNEV